MTAGKAIELCDQMRPNNDFGDEMKQMWLRQCDAQLRQTVVNRSACGDFDAVGADMAGDGLEYDTQLLAPDAFSALYQHWLCAQMDLALGETARAAVMMALWSRAFSQLNLMGHQVLSMGCAPSARPLAL